MLKNVAALMRKETQLSFVAFRVALGYAQFGLPYTLGIRRNRKLQEQAKF